MIQREIINNYHIWPSNQAALKLLADVNIKKEITDSTLDIHSKISILEKRSASLKPHERSEFMKTYARPVINKEKARLSPGP